MTFHCIEYSLRSGNEDGSKIEKFCLLLLRLVLRGEKMRRFLRAGDRHEKGVAVVRNPSDPYEDKGKLGAMGTTRRQRLWLSQYLEERLLRNAGGLPRHQ